MGPSAAVRTSILNGERMRLSRQAPMTTPSYAPTMATTQGWARTDPIRVFAVLADGWQYSSWVVGTGAIRAVEAAWPEHGARLHHAAPWPLMVGDETRVERCEPDRRLVLLARGRPLGEARVDITLTAERGGTRIDLTEEPVSGPGKWAHNPLLDAVLKRRLDESLARLVALAERPVEP
jgi:hypothetical protein